MTSFHYLPFEKFKTRLLDQWAISTSVGGAFYDAGISEWAEPEIIISSRSVFDQPDSINFRVAYLKKVAEKKRQFSVSFPYPDKNGRFHLVSSADREKVTKMEACNLLEPDKGRKSLITSDTFDNLDIDHYLIQPAWERLLFEFSLFLSNSIKISNTYHSKDETVADYFFRVFCTDLAKTASVFQKRDSYGKFAAKVRSFSILTDETNPLALLTQNKSIMRNKAFYSTSEFYEKNEKGTDLWYKKLNEMSMLHELRDIHPSYRGKICPVESPESKKVGLSLQMAAGVSVNNDGRLIVSSDLPGSECSIGVLQIPFMSHNDSARLMMGGKNLKQALPPIEPELPLVKSGWETKAVKMLEKSGYDVFKKSSESGEIISANDFSITVKPFGRSAESYSINLYDVPISGKPLPTRFVKFNNSTNCDAQEPLAVRAGIMQDENGEWSLALGRNLVAVYMPWYGLNFEDAIVISQRAAEKLTTKVIHCLSFPCHRGILPSKGNVFGRGQLFVAGCEESAVPMWATKAEILEVTRDNKKGVKLVCITFAGEMPVEPGDKLMGRYGNKGVVSAILNDDELPTLHYPDGSIVKPDLILNPNGILSRKNPGQLFETQLGLLHQLDKETFDKLKKFAAPFASVDRPDLASEIINALDKKGCQNGQVKISIAGVAGQQFVTAGTQYFCRLNHSPWQKLTLRGQTDAGKGLTEQPRGGIERFGKKVGVDGGQRMGEMEMWAMFSHGALENIREMTKVKSSKRRSKGIHRSFDLALRYLFALGLRVELATGAVSLLKDVQEAREYAQQLNWKVAENSSGIRILDFDQLPALKKKSPEVKSEANENTYFSLAVEHRPFNPFNGSKMEFISILPVSDFPVDAARSTPRKAVISLFSMPYLSRIYERFIRDATNCPENLQKTWERITGLCIKEAKNKSQGRLRVVKPKKNQGQYNLMTLLLGKGGLFRKSLLGRRLDCSGRAVIVPAPDLAPDEVRLPHNYKYSFAANYHPEFCLLNRNPSLHKYSLNSCKISSSSDNESPVIGLSPLLCGPFGADFDGDTMAFHSPIDCRADDEFEAKMSFVDNCFSSATSSNLAHFSLDLKLGIFALEVYNDGKQILQDLYGRYDLSKEYKVSDLLAGVMMLKKGVFNNRKQYLNFMHDLTIAAFKIITQKAYSIGLGDFVALAECYARNAEKIGTDSGSIQKFLKESANRLRETMLFFDIPVSGAKDGKCSDLRQIVARAGQIDCLYSPENTQMSEPGEVKGSYLKGFNPEEFWAACRGGRKGMVKKKLATASAGHFTRLLVESAYPWVVSDLEDCNSCEGIELPAGKTAFRVKVAGASHLYRSPVFCKLINDRTRRYEICQKCLGKNPSTGEFFSAGDYIGVLAAQSLGERGTQESMKAFHKGSGAGKNKKAEDKQDSASTDIRTTIMKWMKSKMSLEKDFLDKNDGLLHTYLKNSDYQNILPLYFEILVAIRRDGNKILSIKNGIDQMAVANGIYGIAGSEGFVKLLERLIDSDAANVYCVATHPKKLLLNYVEETEDI